MEEPIGRYARDSEGYTGITNAAHVLGAGVAKTIRCPAGHCTAMAREGGPASSARANRPDI